MLNVMLASWGSGGDVVPFIGIGATLRARGHDVTLIANPAFGARAAAAGLAFRPVGSLEAYRDLVADGGLWDWRTFGRRLHAHWSGSIEPFYEEIRRRHDTGRSVLVANVLVPAARIVQEELGTPLISVLLSPILLGSRHAPPHPDRPLPSWRRWLGPAGRRLALRALDYRLRIEGRLGRVEDIAGLFRRDVDAFRETRGLPPIATSFVEWAISPQRAIGAWPDWFASRQSDWPEPVTLVDFPLYTATPSASGERPAPWSTLREPIVFTTGTVASSERGFYAAAARACEMLGRPGVLVTASRQQVPAALPPGVVHVEYAPFDELLPRAAAIVHHGGVGTSAQAFAAGIPQIVRPLAGDHFDIAERIERLGVGRMLDHRAPGPRRLAAALRAVLGSAQVAAQCRRWQARLDPARGLDAIADVIESGTSAAVTEQVGLVR